MRDVELMCLDGLAWMMLALCCGRRLGSLVLEDTRWSCDCFLLDGRAWSECRFIIPQRRVGSESGKSS